MSHDWLSPSRAEQLAMGKNWSVVCGPKAALWNIPGEVLTKLDTLTAAAEAVLTKAQSSERTSVITAQCKAAFDALVEHMRYMKNHYFLVPPLTDADLIALGLKPKDTIHTPVPVPTEQAEADILRPGVHVLELVMRITGSGKMPNRGGFRVYWGIMPQGGADVAAATGPKHELMRPPVSGSELPFSKFTKRRRERRDFDAEDSGKTAYFCIRVENAKGDPGPWGTLFSAVIP